MISWLYNILSSDTGQYACVICQNVLISHASRLNIQYFIYVLNAAALVIVQDPCGQASAASWIFCLSLSSRYLSG